jgi:hypothetical protein
MTVRPDLPPGVSVKFIEPNDTAYPKWARGKWSTSYGEGHGIDGYDTREEALDCTWTSWTRFNPDPWVVWADHETARANAAGAARDEARAEVEEQREKAAARVERLTDEWRTETVRLQAEVTRLRARVRVEADDVERAGVTRAQVEAWLAEQNHWRQVATGVWKHSAWGGHQTKVPDVVDAWCVNQIAECSRRPPLDILDEMAAMPLDPKPRRCINCDATLKAGEQGECSVCEARRSTRTR